MKIAVYREVKFENHKRYKCSANQNTIPSWTSHDRQFQLGCFLSVVQT
jgi:hypothetical protein